MFCTPREQSTVTPIQNDRQNYSSKYLDIYTFCQQTGRQSCIHKWDLTFKVLSRKLILLLRLWCKENNNFGLKLLKSARILFTSQTFFLWMMIISTTHLNLLFIERVYNTAGSRFMMGLRSQTFGRKSNRHKISTI
jgi:hypothetical protein